MKNQLPALLPSHLQHDLQHGLQHSHHVRYIFNYLITSLSQVSVPEMSVEVAFEFGRYVVQESCTLLSVTLKVFGEVI